MRSFRLTAMSVVALCGLAPFSYMWSCNHGDHGLDVHGRHPVGGVPPLASAGTMGPAEADERRFLEAFCAVREHHKFSMCTNMGVAHRPAYLNSNLVGEIAVERRKTAFMKFLEMSGAFREVSPPFATPNTTRIPHVLHLSWKSEHVPIGFVENIVSWMEILAAEGHRKAGLAEPTPRWVLLFWTDFANHRLVSDAYERHVPLYKKYSNIQKADFCRYVYLHSIGGTYADLDFLPVKPITPIVDEHALFMGQEPLAHAQLIYRQPRLLCNAMIGSQPRHRFWGQLLSNIGNYLRARDAVQSTGPRMLEREAELWEQRIAHRELALEARIAHGEPRPPTRAEAIWVAPPEMFYPYWDSAAGTALKSICSNHAYLTSEQQDVCTKLNASNYENTISPESVAVHQWSHTYIPAVKVDLATSFDVRYFLPDSGPVPSTVGLPQELVDRINNLKRGPTYGAIFALAPGPLVDTLKVIEQAQAVAGTPAI